AAFVSPPTMMGIRRSGGNGRQNTSLNETKRPLKLARSWLQRARMAATYSSVRGPRSSNGTPRAANSSASQPTPIPRRTRPAPARRPPGRSRIDQDLRTAIRTSSPDLPVRGDLRGFAAEPHDVQPRVGPVREVDESPLVRLDIVGLDRHLAPPRPIRHAALGGPLRRRGNVERGLTRRVGVA